MGNGHGNANGTQTTFLLKVCKAHATRTIVPSMDHGAYLLSHAFAPFWWTSLVVGRGSVERSRKHNNMYMLLYM